ncbi:hypothetical protein Dimus_001720 [Dionaea muscipula]
MAEQLLEVNLVNVLADLENRLRWTEAAMMDGAREIGVSPSIVGSFPRKEAELVELRNKEIKTLYSISMKAQALRLASYPHRNANPSAICVLLCVLAMGRVVIAFSRLADTASEELPSTMAAIRISSLKISDLTLELSELSQEVLDGITKSTQAVKAAEVGIRQIGSLARQPIIQERADLPIISLQPVV